MAVSTDSARLNVIGSVGNKKRRHSADGSLFKTLVVGIVITGCYAGGMTLMIGKYLEILSAKYHATQAITLTIK